MRPHAVPAAALFLAALLLFAQPFPAPPSPIDPQKIQDQDSMTWADYHPIPGVDWADPSLAPTRKRFKIALVAVDFDDQPFVVTLPKKSDLFGNPQIDPIPRAQVPQFYADFYNKPSAVNHGHTINGYWMEQSRGRVGIGKIDAFGPYRMPKKLFQYGLNEWGQAGGAPAGYVADGRLEADADARWRADAGDIKSKYDIVLRIYAGYDETGVWQEFGEMKFQTKEDIPPEWGNPDTAKPRWVPTRYEPWTSWKAGQMQWGLSSVRQGESSGTITHEIVHFAFHVGDNNNNPYEPPYHRAGSGPWDVMDRGAFNGPGGPHSRWVAPAIQGASMPAGLTLRSKIKFGFVKDETALKLTRSGLAASGLAVCRVTARAVEPPPGSFAGIAIKLDGDAPQDRTPVDDWDRNPLSAGRPAFNFYSVEVVQRIGYDSFTPDNGVLIAKNKDREDGNSFAPDGARRGAGSKTGYNCFTWVIDAHPEDIHMLDFKRPNGEPVMRSIADYRQLNDALFHAGLNSGSQFEWEDRPNRLHFYAIEMHKDAQGILSYDMAVRSLDGGGPRRRGVSLAVPATAQAPASTEVSFTLDNTGAPASPPHLNRDVYRLSVSVQGAGWSAQPLNALAAVKSGDSQAIPVYVTRTPGSAATAVVTLTAVSESDPTKIATASCKLTRTAAH